MREQGSASPVVTPAAVGAAGMASAMASVVTSSFGVTGTIIGAAVTAMLVTGGSALLRLYLEGATGKLRTRAQRLRSGVSMPGRPDLRNNLAGRMRAALEWFSHLPISSRRSIVIKGAIAAAVAFVLAMGAVWAGERLIGNSLSCGLWSECPEGAEPGIHFGGDGKGAGSTLTFARGDAPGSTNDSGPSGRDAVTPGGAQQGSPSGTQEPGVTPSTSSSPGGGASDRPVSQNGGAVIPAPDSAEEPPTDGSSGETSVPVTPEEPAAEDPAAEPQPLMPAE